ncbi:hypothetical protein RND71_009797 [Anisodus tanguticus]|uniref:Uncharacterized protein n=1 Tax=Anisodus tanguticus TaxID=243964 RepID=A0AAE1SJ11_9SOLA|nr:hypothetical protein RND71_009797 [Anisodus tanguticus]
MSDNIDVEVVMDTSQQVTLKLFFQELNQYMLTTLVYAKYDVNEKLELWDYTKYTEAENQIKDQMEQLEKINHRSFD